VSKIAAAFHRVKNNMDFAMPRYVAAAISSRCRP
jgi:hypothetical protein